MADRDGVILTAADLWAMVGRVPRDPLNSIFAEDVKINLSAKFKPVKRSGAVRTPDFWRANDGNCGIVIPVLEQLSEIGSRNWIYDRPKGGVDTTVEPNFMNDYYFFGRYNHYATPIISSGYESAIRWNRLVDDTLTLTARYNHAMEGSTVLGIEDIPNLSSRFYAVAIGNSEPDAARAKSAELTLGAGGVSLKLTTQDISNMPVGRTNLWFFLAAQCVYPGEPDAVYGKYAILSDARYLNPVPLEVVEESPVTATFLRIRNKLGAWVGFGSVVAVQEDTLTLVEVQFTNVTSQPADIKVEGFSTVTTANRGENIAAVKLNTDISGTNELSTLSLAAGESKVFYTWVDFLTEFFPKPEIDASIRMRLSAPTVAALSIGFITLKVQ